MNTMYKISYIHISIIVNSLIISSSLHLDNTYKAFFSIVARKKITDIRLKQKGKKIL